MCSLLRSNCAIWLISSIKGIGFFPLWEIGRNQEIPSNNGSSRCLFLNPKTLFHLRPNSTFQSVVIHLLASLYSAVACSGWWAHNLSGVTSSAQGQQCSDARAVR